MGFLKIKLKRLRDRGYKRRILILLFSMVDYSSRNLLLWKPTVNSTLVDSQGLPTVEGEVVGTRSSLEGATATSEEGAANREVEVVVGGGKQHHIRSVGSTVGYERRNQSQVRFLHLFCVFLTYQKMSVLIDFDRTKCVLLYFPGHWRSTG